MEWYWAIRARVIGCLMRKICTPDRYPLSLNALVACSQKSNREPVLELAELDIRAVIDEADPPPSGGQYRRFQRQGCPLSASFLQIPSSAGTSSQPGLGIICELLLRGPQTPGELRSRTNQLCSDDVTEGRCGAQPSHRAGPYVVRKTAH